MTIKVLTIEGIKYMQAAELTFREHLTVIEHWRAVFHSLTLPGRLHEGDEDWLAERMAVMDEAERKLRAGEVPYLIEGPS